MKLKVDGWNIQSKEEFVLYLLKDAHAKFYEAKASGRISNEEYWDIWDDLCMMSDHFLGIKIESPIIHLGSLDVTLEDVLKENIKKSLRNSRIVAERIAKSKKGSRQENAKKQR